MRFLLSLTVALACFSGLARACDYGQCAVQVQAAPVVYAQPVLAPVQVQYAAPAVVAAPVYAAPAFVPSYGVQRAFAPSYGYGGAAFVQRSFVSSGFAVQRSVAVRSAVVAPAAVVQQDVSVRRGGLFGRREVIRSRTVVR